MERPYSCGLYNRTVQTICCPRATNSVYIPKLLLLTLSPHPPLRSELHHGKSPCPPWPVPLNMGSFPHLLGRASQGDDRAAHQSQTRADVGHMKCKLCHRGVTGKEGSAPVFQETLFKPTLNYNLQTRPSFSALKCSP